MVASKINAAMLAVADGVGTVPKLGVMKFGGTEYKYVRNDDILERISELLVANKIIVRPSFTVEDVVRGTRPFVYVHLTQTYIHSEDGSEVSISVVGEAAAGDDKSIRKAVTQSQKMANLLTFSIATGEPDPDGIPYQEPKPVAGNAKVAAAKQGGDAASLFNEVKAFLGANKIPASVANVLGARLSDGKPSAEWTQDVTVLKAILEALKNGEVE